MTYNPIRARQLLVTGTGRSDAKFREDQENAIRHIVEGRGRLLLVQKTGWGKSSVYFIHFIKDGSKDVAKNVFKSARPRNNKR